MKFLEALISFYTILPLRYHNLEYAAEYSYLSPLVVGFTTGSIAGIVCIILGWILPPCILAVIALSVLLLLTGFTHVDGLMDVADALMFRGSREERLKILHDKYCGSAAVITVLVVELTSIMSLTILICHSLLSAVIAIIIAEVVARIPHVILAYLGPLPNYHGLGYTFVSRMLGRVDKLVKMFILTLPVVIVLSLLAGITPKVILLLVVLLPLTLLYRAVTVRSFGFITGDILGASIELFRTVSLITLSIGL